MSAAPEQVVLEVLAKAGNFDGFKAADDRLKAIDAMLGVISEKFENLFKKSPDTTKLTAMHSALSGIADDSQKVATAETQAAKATDAHADKVAKLNQQLIEQKKRQGQLIAEWKSLKRVSSAGEIVRMSDGQYDAYKKQGEGYGRRRKELKESRAEILRIEQAIASFKTAGIPNPTGASKSPTLGTGSGKTEEINLAGAKVNLIVPGYDVIASLTGKVKLVVTADQIDGAIPAPTGSGAGGKSGGKGSGGGDESPPREGPPLPAGMAGGGGAALKVVEDLTAETAKTTAALDDFFKNTNTVHTKGIGAAKEEVKTVQTLNHAGTEWAKVQNDVAIAAQKLKSDLKAISQMAPEQKAKDLNDAYSKFATTVQDIRENAKTGLISTPQQTKLTGLVSAARDDADVTSMRAEAAAKKSARATADAEIAEAERSGRLLAKMQADAAAQRAREDKVAKDNASSVASAQVAAMSKAAKDFEQQQARDLAGRVSALRQGGGEGTRAERQVSSASARSVEAGANVQTYESISSRSDQLRLEYHTKLTAALREEGKALEALAKAEANQREESSKLLRTSTLSGASTQKIASEYAIKSLEASGLLGIDQARNRAMTTAASAGGTSNDLSTAKAQANLKHAQSKQQLYTELLASPDVEQGSAMQLSLMKRLADTFTTLGAATTAATQAQAAYTKAQQASFTKSHTAAIAAVEAQKAAAAKAIVVQQKVMEAALKRHESEQLASSASTSAAARATITGTTQERALAGAQVAFAETGRSVRLYQDILSATAPGSQLHIQYANKLSSAVTAQGKAVQALTGAHTNLLRASTATTASGQMDAARSSVAAQINALRQLKAAQVAAIPAAATPAQRSLAKAQANASYQGGVQGVYGGMAATAANPAILAMAQQRLGVQTVAAANATQQLHAAQANATASANNLGKNIIKNIQHVTGWAASVGLLYGALGMVKRGMGSFTEIEYQVARLSQVFRHGQEQVGGLTDGILRMASANGRSTQEAMESAIQWSRLGLNRVEVNEAVRVSLRAANVAEISSAEATEHLSSMMSVYSLKATELEGVLGMLNATSNTFNVTNAQLFEGITRTSAAAKQAGLSLAELVGLIGAGVGSTGQTGANIGNAIKSMIGSLTAPDKQKMMRESFGFETIDPNTGGIKNMSALLGDMFVKMQSLTAAGRQSFIFGLAGKNQASRVTALLDNYIKANELAIHALLNLNSAETENEKIKATLKNQLVGLISEFERFAYTMTNIGAQVKDNKTGKLDFDFTGGAVLKTAVNGLKDLLSVMSAFGGAGGALILSFLVALTARLAITAATTGAAGASAGFLRNSWAALARAGAELRTVLISQGVAMTGFSAATLAASRSAMALTMALGALRLALTAMAWTAIISAIVIGIGAAFGKLTNWMGLSSDAADKAFDNITSKAQQAGAAAEAASLQIKLLDTATRALAAQSSRSERAKIIERTVDAVETDPAKRADLRRELTAINQIADATQRNAAFQVVSDRISVELATKRIKKRQEEAALDMQAMREAQLEMDRLNRKWFASEEAKKKQLEKIETLKKRRQQRRVEEDDDRTSASDQARAGEPHKKYAATTQAVMDDIKNLFADMPGSTFGDMLNKELMTLSQQNEMLLDQKKLIDEKRNAIVRDEDAQAEADAERQVSENSVEVDRWRRIAQGQAGRETIIPGIGITTATGVPIPIPTLETHKTGLGLGDKIDGKDILSPSGEEALKKLRERWNAGGGGGMKGPSATAEEKAQLDALIASVANYNALSTEGARLEAERRRLAAQNGGRQNGAAYARLQVAEAENAASREAVRIKMEAENQRRAVADIRDQRAVGKLFAGVEIGVAGASGNNAPQETAARLAAARKISKQSSEEAKLLQVEKNLALQFNKPGEAARIDIEMQVQLGRAMEANNQIALEMNNIVKQRGEAEQAVIKAQKEWNKSIALSGPGDLLRKMAMSKLTNNFKNSNGAQFMAWDAGARREMEPRFAANRALGDANKNFDAMFGKEGMAGYVKRMKELQQANLALMAQGAAAQQTAVNNSARAAVAMTAQLDNASLALESFAREVRAAIRAVAERGGTALTQVKTPQNNTAFA